MRRPTLARMDLRELGAFLRLRRDRLRPADVGLAAGPRRRVPGLRRSEVAQLAGTSAQYYSALEQATGAQPSARTLAALARALRLGIDERDHVYRLAGRAVPNQGGAASHVPPAALDLIDALTTPAQVLTDLHVVLAQNRLAALLFGPADGRSGPEAGLVNLWGTDDGARWQRHVLHPSVGAVALERRSLAVEGRPPAPALVHPGPGHRRRREAAPARGRGIPRVLQAMTVSCSGVG